MQTAILPCQSVVALDAPAESEFKVVLDDVLRCVAFLVEQVLIAVVLIGLSPVLGAIAITLLIAATFR